MFNSIHVLSYIKIDSIVELIYPILEFIISLVLARVLVIHKNIF